MFFRNFSRISTQYTALHPRRERTLNHGSLFGSFVCNSFTDTVSNSDSTASDDWMTVNNESGNMKKEAVVT
jgi:hypothetical protein